MGDDNQDIKELAVAPEDTRRRKLPRPPQIAGPWRRAE